MPAQRKTQNVKSTREAGNEGHRDEDERFEARAEAFRLHEVEGWSLRTIAKHQGTTAPTVQNDIEWYRKYLAHETPKTFEALRARCIAKYQRQYEMAEHLYQTASSSFVQAQALKQMVELTQLEAALYGVDKGVTAPVPEEEAPQNEIEWGAE